MGERWGASNYATISYINILFSSNCNNPLMLQRSALQLALTTLIEVYALLTFINGNDVPIGKGRR